MKHQETLLNFPINGNKLNGFSFDEIGDDHLYTGIETPLTEDAFLLNDEEKKEKISDLFAQIMEVMGLDLTDDSLKGTPKRVAKMYIDEIFSGLKVLPSWSGTQVRHMPSLKISIVTSIYVL